MSSVNYSFPKRGNALRKRQRRRERPVVLREHGAGGRWEMMRDEKSLLALLHQLRAMKEERKDDKRKM